MIKLLKSQQGSSLVQVIIAFGLMSVLSLAITKMNTENLKANKRVEYKGEIESLNREIISFMSDAEACNNTFGGLGADLSLLKINGTMSLVEIKDKNDIAKFSTSTKRMGVSINSITVTAFDVATDSASLDVLYGYRLGKVDMERVRKTSLSFTFNSTNTNILERCISRSGIKNIDPKQVCDMVVGLDVDGISYFVGGICLFQRAACEGAGKFYNELLDICEETP